MSDNSGDNSSDPRLTIPVHVTLVTFLCSGVRMRIPRVLPVAVCAAMVATLSPALPALAANVSSPTSSTSADPAPEPSVDPEPVVDPTVEPTPAPSPTDTVEEDETSEQDALDLPAPNIATAEAGNKAAYLDWAPVAGATNYKVRVTVHANHHNIPNPGKGSVSLNLGNTSAVIASLTNTVTYALEVATVDSAGVTGDYSAPVYVTPDGVPNVMGSPSLAGLTRTGMSVKWSAGSIGTGAPAITDYRVTYDNLDGYSDVVHSVPASALTDTVTGLQPGSQYAIRVAAVNAEGAGPASVVPLYATPNGPATPSGLNVTSAGNRVVNFGWNAVDGAASYKVKVAVAANPDNIPTPSLGTVTYSGTTAKVAGLTNGVTYEVSVAAVDAAGLVSDYSASVTAAPIPAPAPTGLVVTAVGNGATYLDWDAVSKATGYRVYVTVLDAHGIANPSLGSSSVSFPGSSSVTTGLTNGVLYGFEVVASVDGYYTAKSTQVTATPDDVPNRMAAPGASAITGTSVTVKWAAATVTGTAGPVQGYTLKWWPSNTPTAVHKQSYDASTLTGTASGLTRGTEYSFTVSATNDAGPSPESPVYKVVASDKPGAVMNLTVGRSADGTSAVLDWDAPQGMGGATITKYSISGSPAITPAVIDTVNTRATITNLAAGTNYKFTVYAYTTSGAGAGASITSIAQVPAITAGPVMSADGRVALTFTDVPNENYGYDVSAFQVEQFGAKKNLQSMSIVTADTVTCTAGSCTAIWNQFGDNIDGQAWTFRTRAVDGVIGYSSWAYAYPSAPVSPVNLATAILNAPNWFINYAGDWNTRTDMGVWDMLVNGAPAVNGDSGSLGMTPGNVNVTFRGLGGSATEVFELPTTPAVPDVPVITDIPTLNSDGNATVQFTQALNATAYEAVAAQTLTGGALGADLTVEADDVTCSSGVCTATWIGFGPAVNGKPWTFKVRGTNGVGSNSAWATALPQEPVNADTATAATQGTDRQWTVSYTDAWTGRTDAGVWSMTVNGKPALGGSSGPLGLYPGDVTTTLLGIGGSSSTVHHLPTGPDAPDTPVITSGPAISTAGKATLAFTPVTATAAKYEARATSDTATVNASATTCDASSCTAAWNNFGRFIDGDAWTFQVRSVVDGVTSAWVSQTADVPADPAVMTEAQKNAASEYTIQYKTSWASRVNDGVWSMLVNDEVAVNGVSDNLGKYPGTVTVSLIGLGGTKVTDFPLPDKAMPVEATGGTTVDYKGWRYHYFLSYSPGMLTVTNPGDVTIMVGGGGGSGGGGQGADTIGGSGGAGRVISGTYAVQAGKYETVPGAGGANGYSGGTTRVVGPGVSLYAAGGGAGSAYGGTSMGGWNGGGGGLAMNNWPPCSGYVIPASQAQGGNVGIAGMIAMQSSGGCGMEQGKGGGAGGAAYTQYNGNQETNQPGPGVTLPLPVSAATNYRIQGVVGAGDFGSNQNSSNGGSSWNSTPGDGGFIVIAYPLTLGAPMPDMPAVTAQASPVFDLDPFTYTVNNGEVTLTWNTIPAGQQYILSSTGGDTGTVCTSSQPTCTFHSNAEQVFYIGGQANGYAPTMVGAYQFLTP